MFDSLVSGREVCHLSEYVPDISRTVCITGHRERYVPPYEGMPVYQSMTISSVKLMLYRYLDMAVSKGYTNFISGLAMGTDLWAAEYILEKRRFNKDIRIFGMMPFRRHAERFTPEYLEILRKIELQADKIFSVCEDPDLTYGRRNTLMTSNTLYRDRNYCMVDNSSAVIAFMNADCIASGTAQTVNYANRRGRKVCRFSIDDVFDVIKESGPDIRSIGRNIALLENVFDMPW